jgi:hypothetical protein
MASSQTTDENSASTAAFELFPKLPPELRHQIWLDFLDDATPLIHTFTISYSRNGRSATTTPEGDPQDPQDPQDPWYRVRRYQPGDQVILKPVPRDWMDNRQLSPKSLPGLPSATLVQRIASAVCIESRRAVLAAYPNVLRFYLHSPLLPDSVSERSPVPAVEREGVSPPHPGFVLRFNASRDVIVFHAYVLNQVIAQRIAQLNKAPPDAFAGLRHVGINVAEGFSLRTYGFSLLPRLPRLCRCRCEGEECRDSCRKDLLTGFLSLFPNLETFYLADTPALRGYPRRMHDVRAGDNDATCRPGGTRNCPCPPERPGHVWPVMRHSSRCGWYLVYNERDGSCHFDPIAKIEELRQTWRQHFPYYKALDHVKIRFIRLWNSQRCPLC